MHRYVAKGIRFIRNGLLTILQKFYRFRKIVPNRIVIATNTFHYTCNPKYIYQELIKEDADLDICWLVQDPEKDRKSYPAGAKLVKFYSAECARVVSTAKVWLNNGIVFSNVFDKRPGQIYIQTMHGSLGIKKMENAVTSRLKRGRFRVVQREEKNTDLVITNSQFEEDVFRTIFWHDSPMKRLGHARTDILFAEFNQDKLKEVRRQLKAEYGIPEEKKLVMYAPTHRIYLTKEQLDIDYEQLCAALSERFGGEFAVLLRLHDMSGDVLAQIKKDLSSAGLLGTLVYDVGDYPDVQELMLVIDAGITDYSSWIYDYVVTAKPGFIYANDQERYLSVTGLCYPLTATPFPVCSSNEELEAAVRDFDMDLYKKKVTAFLEEKAAVDDGHSAKRAADCILELMGIRNGTE